MTTAENTNTGLLDEVKLTLTPRQTENFWAKVSKAPHPKGCWEWTGSRHYKGYGLFGFGRKIHKSHRVSFRLSKSEIPSGIKVCHSCDNPPCVNPAHLWLGTDQENCDDKIAKGRDNCADAENNGGGGKLTWEQVREIRALLACGGIPQQSIANQFGVSQILISLIHRNKIWKENAHG